MSFSLFLLGCGSGGEDVNNLFDIDGPEVEVPPNNNLTITITKPHANGMPTGYIKTFSGTCGTPGILIRIDVDGLVGQSFAVCGIDNRWTANVDTSTQPVGNISVSARMVDEDVIGNAATRVINKLSTICDDPVRRADTFANFSTTGVPPWEVCTSVQLSNIGTTYRNDDITIMNDISFGGGGYVAQAGTGGGFTGIFEGNNFEIANFVINQTTTAQVGLFREATGAIFRNVRFDNVSVSGRYHLGLLAGYLEPGNTTISNIVASNVTMEAFDGGSNGYVGALFGATRAGAMNINVSDIDISSININSFKNNQGGVIGYVNNITGLTMSRISVNGGQINGRQNVGGVIGYIHQNIPTANVNADRIYNTANVSCSLGQCGGVVGYANGTFTDLFNTGTITRSGGNSVGGLIGYLRAGSLIGSSLAATRGVVSPPNVPTAAAPTVDGSGWPVSCYNTGSVVGAGGNNIGGVIGFTYRTAANVSRCYNTGTVTGASFVGGLIGRAERADIIDSYSEANITGEDDYVGGLLGYMENYAPSSTISDSYATGIVVTGGLHPQYIGGLAGRWNPPTTLNTVWFNGDILAVNGDDTAVTTDIGGLIGYAYTNNTGCVNCHTAGSIDVQIIGNTQAHQYVAGLIGRSRADVDSSSSTMTVYAPQVTGVGGLIGYDYRRTVTNSYATGDVTGYRQVGGLIGFADRFENVVEDSFATGDVLATKPIGDTAAAWAGGLVGVGGANIRRSFASGNVTATGDYVGGLEGGRNQNWNRDLIRSFATGNVDAGTGRYVGGLSGHFRGYANRLVDNFATGTVRGGDSVGGLVGFIRRNENNVMRRNYATGQVTRATGGTGADSRIGPMVGEINNGNGSIDAANNFFVLGRLPLDEATGLAIGAPNLINVNALSPAQFIDSANFGTNFVGFDFGTPIWEAPSSGLVLPGHSTVYRSPVPDWLE